VAVLFSLCGCCFLSLYFEFFCRCALSATVSSVVVVVMVLSNVSSEPTNPHMKMNRPLYLYHFCSMMVVLSHHPRRLSLEPVPTPALYTLCSFLFPFLSLFFMCLCFVYWNTLLRHISIDHIASTRCITFASDYASRHRSVPRACPASLSHSLLLYLFLALVSMCLCFCDGRVAG
jgi:hypothetical protein